MGLDKDKNHGNKRLEIAAGEAMARVKIMTKKQMEAVEHDTHIHRSMMKEITEKEIEGDRSKEFGRKRKNIEEQRRWEAKMERKNDEQLEKERMADEVKSAAKQEEIDKRLAGMAKKRQAAVNARDAFRVKEDTEKKTI